VSDDVLSTQEWDDGESWRGGVIWHGDTLSGSGDLCNGKPGDEHNCVFGDDVWNVEVTCCEEIPATIVCVWFCSGDDSVLALMSRIMSLNMSYGNTGG
jgi:hypothetical protein